MRETCKCGFFKESHRTCCDNAPPRTRDANPAPAIHKGGDDTAAAGSPPPAGEPGIGGHTNGCRVGRQPRRLQASKPCPRGPPRTTPQSAACATHSNNACRSGTPAGKTSTCPARPTDTQRTGASLSSPWCRTRTTIQRLPPTSSGQEPPFPDPRNPPATEKGTAPNRDLSFHLTLLPREPDPQRAGPGGQPDNRPTKRTHGRADDHGNVIEQSSRMLPSNARIKGYVHRGNL